MIDLTKPRRVHIVGVGGAGMSAIATVLVAMGHHVSGSDLKDSAGLRRLETAGVRVHVGHDAGHVGDADLVAVSTAIPERNPEVVAAKERDVPVVRRAEILAAIASTRRCVAVSGTHGKTTTSSMLALALVQAGLEPSFIIGGELNEIGGGAVWSDGDLFVVEADESDGTFVELPAEIAIVTNVEADHLDFYGSLDAIEASFDRFLQAPGPNVVCADDPIAARLGRAHGAVLYGTSEDADVRIVDPVSQRSGSSFTLVRGDEVLGDLRLPVPGLHNMRNATAATIAALSLGAPFDACQSALARYAGVARRFEYKGRARGVTFVDDYAHNPGKVRALLEGARAGGWRRIVCAFQPHRYSRTAALAAEFGEAFDDADIVAIMDVYAAGEPPQPGVTGKLVVDAVLDRHPWKRVAWVPGRDDILTYLALELRPDDLCLTVGAGDVTSLSGEIVDRIA
ncbi:MAG: UDP-N-acetylmuramate--alanine ligase [Acidimicrobiaceae bacterium]